MTPKQLLIKEYISIYGYPPKKSMRAIDIQKSINKYHYGIQRAKTLKP